MSQGKAQQFEYSSPSRASKPTKKKEMPLNRENIRNISTYDHKTRNTEDPVRSPVHKSGTDGLVLRWVTTGESLLLYVFFSMSIMDLGGLDPECE